MNSAKATKTRNISLKSHTFHSEINWLKDIVAYRLSKAEAYDSQPVAPEVDPVEDDHYGQFLRTNRLSDHERLMLIIALVPHLTPEFFDKTIQQNLPQTGDFPQLGGVRGKNFRGFLPTGETAVFLLAGDDLEYKFQAQSLLNPDGYFAKQQILWLDDPPKGEPLMSGKIVVSQEFVELCSHGEVSTPRFGSDFPAQRIETQMEWEDLVLPTDTMHSIKDLEIWVNHGDKLLKQWGMSRKLKPGYRVLFHGPPGTGKTLTASLLGKHTGKEVYKIDLSMVVSKFIGETEKNLANLFDKAENRDWILFFDEADALFGKRTNVRDAHDKYANQEVSFLLQRTENYSGMVILATNFKSNIDDAFARRFQSHIYFPAPKYAERLKLWKLAFPKQVKLENKVDLSGLARQYELTGAHIANVVQHSCLQAISKKSKTIWQDDILTGIRKEYNKEGKTI